jgi:uncharacterized protein (DUF1501 family)
MDANRFNRRTALKVLGGAAAAGLASQPLFRALADPPLAQDDFFIFIHASGGWDVTVGLDPRNESRGLIDPATTDFVDSAGLTQWVDEPIGTDTTFRIITPRNTRHRFGPGVGDLVNIAERVTVINGLAMNTVSHQDGTYFAATGRHLAGGRAVASSVNTMIANEFGRDQIFPSVSVQFPSAYVGSGLDPRASPLVIANVDTVSKVLARANDNTVAADRDAVTAMLSQESRDLMGRSYHEDVMEGFSLQFGALRRMLNGNLQAVFQSAALQSAQPSFNYRARFQSRGAINAAFAVEAMKRNVVRCVSFAMGGFDTHSTNYRNQPMIQQEFFNVLTALVRALDAAPHPTRMGERLSDRTHILAVSDFCRTPQINLTSGRDHYPNGSAIVISPRFRGGNTYGASDVDQLLPAPVVNFPSGMRAIAPPDLLATFLGAFGVDPRRYMRDGEVVRALIRA